MLIHKSNLDCVPQIEKHCTRMRWVVNFTPWPLYPPGREQWCPWNRRLGRPQLQARHLEEWKQSLALPRIQNPVSRSAILIMTSDKLSLTKVYNIRYECVVLCFFFTSCRKYNAHPPHNRFLERLLTYTFCFKLSPTVAWFRCPVATVKTTLTATGTYDHIW